MISQNTTMTNICSITILEASAIAFTSAPRSYCENSILVDVAHGGCLLSQVLGSVLNYAEGINPNVLNSQPDRNYHCILKRSAQISEDYLFVKRIQISLRKSKEFDLTPAVTESSIVNMFIRRYCAKTEIFNVHMD